MKWKIRYFNRLKKKWNDNEPMMPNHMKFYLSCSKNLYILNETQTDYIQAIHFSKPKSQLSDIFLSFIDKNDHRS